MNPDMRLKEKVRHGTARHPISGMRFTLEPEKSHPQHFFVERHWHPQIEILYFIKGTFDVEINFETTVFHEGELCILNSEDLHQITGKEPHTAHEALVFDPDILTFSYMDDTNDLSGIMFFGPQDSSLLFTVIGAPYSKNVDTIAGLLCSLSPLN